MKQVLFFVAVFFLTMYVNSKPQFGNARLFNDNWRFILSDVKDGANPVLDDSKWRQLNLPHDWSVEGTYSPDKASCQGYLPGGIGWYRKKFNVPVNEKDKKIYIYFEGVYNRSEVFINGTSIGKRPYGYISFMYDLTPYLKFGKENTLCVRVDHSLERDSRWYSGSGIYRNVYLVSASRVHIDLWGVYLKASNVNDKKANVSIETTINNTFSSSAKVELTNEIIDPLAGKVVASGSKIIHIQPQTVVT